MLFPTGRNSSMASLLSHPSITVASCRFHQTGASWLGFPHFFQQLLRCFSWWNAKGNSERTPVLSIWNIPPSPWALGLIQALQLEQIKIKSPAECKHVGVLLGNAPDTPRRSPPSYEIATAADTDFMRRIVYSYAANSSNGSSTFQGGCPSTKQLSRNKTAPIVGFLNRGPQSGRHVVNHKEILESVSKELPNLEIVYMESFDGASFQDQISFMANIDILISPHGAQVTNAAFLPQCGSVFELFPTGYFVPHFYGSLSRSTGHYHFYMYTGNRTTMQNDLKYYMASLTRRKRAWAFNITVEDPSWAVDAVREMISKWQSCCRKGEEP